GDRAAHYLPECALWSGASERLSLVERGIHGGVFFGAGILHLQLRAHLHACVARLGNLVLAAAGSDIAGGFAAGRTRHHGAGDRWHPRINRRLRNGTRLKCPTSFSFSRTTATIATPGAARW